MVAPSIFPRIPALVAASLCCLGPAAHAGPVSGAVDTFPSQVHADAWRVYDYSDGEEYLPNWYDETDPFIGLAHVNDSPLWFFAGPAVAQGAFVGDYTRDDILAIGVDFFIDNGFDFLDCAVFTQGPVGLTYYYSGAAFGTDYPEAGWQQIDFRFDEPWYYWDATASQFMPVQVDDTFLSNISEIGFRFFPQSGNTTESVAAIDNVAMVPTVVAPRLQPSVTGGQFRISFTPMPGTKCDLLRFVPGLVNPWPEIAGQTHIVGPGVHQYTTPITPPTGLFRVRAKAHYTEVVTPP